MYAGVFKVNPSALEKYNAEQLVCINQAVGLIENRIKATEILLMKNDISSKRSAHKLAKAYTKAICEALVIIPMEVLIDIVSDDGIIGGGNGLTHREYLRLQYLSEERSQNIKASKIAQAKLLVNFALDVTFATFGARADDIKDERLRTFIEVADDSEAVEALKFENIYDDDEVRGMAAIICKNKKLFDPPTPYIPPAPPRKRRESGEDITGEDVANMTLGEIDDWIEDLLKP